MKRILEFLLCVVLLFAVCGCFNTTGYIGYTGVYVKTSQGQHILIHDVEGKEEYFVLHAAEGCKSLDKLKTGDKITIQVPCISYEEADISERTVYEWERNLFGRAEVSQSVLDHIEELLKESTS